MSCLYYWTHTASLAHCPHQKTTTQVVRAAQNYEPDFCLLWQRPLMAAPRCERRTSGDAVHIVHIRWQEGVILAQTLDSVWTLFESHVKQSKCSVLLSFYLNSVFNFRYWLPWPSSLDLRNVFTLTQTTLVFLNLTEVHQLHSVNRLFNVK